MVAALTDAAYQHYVPILGRKPRPMLDDHTARIARGETFLLEDAADLVGLISLIPKDDTLHIYSIAVAPEAQGRGHLRALLDFAENTAKEQGLSVLSLHTNVLMTRNRAIYAHLGFVETGISDGGGYKIVFMAKPIAP